MKRDVGAIEIDVRPDQLEDLVLRRAPVAAVEQDGEDRFGLPRAGFLASPASDGVAVQLGPQGTQREHVEAWWGRRGIGERLAQRRPAGLDICALGAQNGQRRCLHLVPLRKLEARPEIRRGEGQRLALRWREGEATSLGAEDRRPVPLAAVR